MVVRCLQEQVFPWAWRMRRALAALTAELLRKGEAAGSFIFARHAELHGEAGY